MVTTKLQTMKKVKVKKSTAKKRSEPLVRGKAIPLPKDGTIRISGLATGMRFTATINQKKVTGKIFVRKDSGEIFFCQNKADGSDAPNKLGYKYSWVTANGHNLVHGEILGLKLYNAPKGYVAPKEPLRVGSHEVRFSRGYIQVGCTRVENKKVLEIAEMLKK